MKLAVAIAVLMLVFAAHTEAQEEHSIVEEEQTIRQEEPSIEQGFATFQSHVKELAEKTKNTFEQIHQSEFATKTRDWFTEMFEEAKQKMEKLIPKSD